MKLVALFLPVAIFCAPLLGAQPDVQGVYRSIASGVTLPGGLKNLGSPDAILLAPATAATPAVAAPAKDPWKMCQPVGPFRMMAVDGVKIELAPAGSRIVMLFEDASHGLMRTIYMQRGHREKRELTWMGDSVGRWEGDVLVVDTLGFNGETWLNGRGAQHSEALHLVERIHPISGGRYLEYKMTAEDPKALVKPYTYTRYFQKLDSEIVDDVCRDQE